MKELIFHVWMPVRVEISRPSGVPGVHFHVNIGGYHYGTLLKIDGKWVAHLNPKAQKELTADDIQALGDWIDERFPD